ncbi:MAG: hypothetical protein ACE5D6_10120, partial [Candidatus Zixiibacteriota bacterium]
MKSGNFFYPLILSLIFIACGNPYRKTSEVYQKKDIMKHKVEVEAYLFDSKITRKGKPTTFRLEIFQTDSVMALGGRGYLGKGALKGRLTADSIEVFFPASKEYLYEAVSDLMESFNCVGELPSMNFLDLFHRLPDEVLINSNMSVIADYKNKKRPEFQISFPQCSWQLKLTYDHKAPGWRIRNFIFSDGDK